MNYFWAGFLFCSTACYDALWAVWTRCVTDRKAAAGSAASLLIYLLGIVNVISYVNNFWYVVPVALGGATGTFFSIKGRKRKVVG